LCIVAGNQDNVGNVIDLCEENKNSENFAKKDKK
jgi:hypothetical protein